MTDDMYEQAYHGVQKALDYALGTDETAGAGAGIVADAMLLAQRYMELRGAVLAGEAGAHTVERLEDPERTEALLIHYERAVEALRPVEGSTPIASPAAVGICGAVAPLLMNGVWTKHCTLPAGHDGWHQDDGEPPMMWSVDGGSFAQQSTMPPAAAPAGEVVSVPPPAMITIELELLKAFYDMAVGSMDYSSGFFDSTETDQIAYVGRLLGVDQTPPDEPTPHLWHQDCALPWRCGQSAGAEIHRMEMPNA